MRVLLPARAFLSRIGRPGAAFLGGGAILVALFFASARGGATQGAAAQSPNSEAALLDGFRHVEVASVSDALEQLTGKKMYMTHRMRPIFPTRFAGHALTVLLKKIGRAHV